MIFFNRDFKGNLFLKQVILVKCYMEMDQNRIVFFVFLLQKVNIKKLNFSLAEETKNDRSNALFVITQ